MYKSFSILLIKKVFSIILIILIFLLAIKLKMFIINTVVAYDDGKIILK